MRLKAILGTLMVSSVLLLSGCQLFLASELSESEINDFIRTAVENFTDNTGYTLEGDIEGESFMAKYDGTNLHIEGVIDGEESEIYSFDGATYIYGVIPELGEDPTWIKFSGDTSTPIPDEVLVDSENLFEEEELSDEYLDENFTYKGVESCPGDISGDCHVFEVEETTGTSTAYFHAGDERLVQVISQSTEQGELTITFNYDGTIEVSLPEEAKDAIDYNELLNSFLQDLEGVEDLDTDNFNLESLDL